MAHNNRRTTAEAQTSIKQRYLLCHRIFFLNRREQDLLMPMIQLTIVTYVMLTVRQIATFLLISTAPFVITTIAHPMPSIFGINRQRRTPHKVNPTSPSQAEGEPRQSSQTQQGSGTCRKNAKRLLLWGTQCAESQGEGFQPKGSTCYSVQEMSAQDAFGECFAPKRPHLFVGTCPAWSWNLAKLPARECAQYSPIGWTSGKNENKKEWNDCLGIKAMETYEDESVGICFQPANKDYKKSLGKCSAWLSRKMTTGQLCHDRGGQGFEDFSEVKRCWPPDKMLDPKFAEVVGHCYGARSS